MSYERARHGRTIATGQSPHGEVRGIECPMLTLKSSESPTGSLSVVLAILRWAFSGKIKQNTVRSQLKRRFQRLWDELRVAWQLGMPTR